MQINAENLMIYSDSQLLVRQVQGQYKVKSDKILPLYEQALNLLSQFRNWKIQHIVRAKNTIADGLVNQALDLEQDIESKPESKVTSEKPLRLGVLLSGGGRTLLNILENINDGRLNAVISIVISSRSTVAGVGRARNAGLHVRIIRKKDYPEIDEFSRQIAHELEDAKVDLVVQAGWLCLWKIPERFENRVMNIHPALLPSFGGKGMYGHHVHEAVLKTGCKISGCTVHFCTNEYDKGPIIVQRACPAFDSDTADTLATRVFEQECIAYPEAIRLFAANRLRIREGIVEVKPG